MGNKKKTLIIIATAITVAIVLAILLSLRGCKSQIMSTCTIIGFYADQDSEVFNVVTVGDHKKSTHPPQEK